MYTMRIVNKVPGTLQSESKKEKQGYIGDYSKKTDVQLDELLQRQCKLLANKAFINKLPDKGEKIMNLKGALEEELKKRNERADLSNMMSGLCINSKRDLDALEWTRQCVPGQLANQEEANVSDDDSDPFRILASHSGAGFHKKKIKELKPEKQLIKPSDIAAGDEVNAEIKEEELEEFAKHLCERFDASNSVAQPKTRFLPNRTLKTASSSKTLPKTVGKYWEVTAATPPPPIHGDTKLVSLHDSIRLQMEQQAKLKNIQIKHAMERLGTWQGNGIGKLPQNVGGYRDQPSCSSSDDEGSEHEVHDEEYPDGGGVVIYNLVDDIND